MLTPHRVCALLVALPLAACAPDPISYPTEMEMTTWSIVGVDPKSGDVGVAVASCVPMAHPLTRRACGAAAVPHPKACGA